jgi:hypothetical protein
VELWLLVCVLCSKRKVLRAWKAAMAEGAPAAGAATPGTASDKEIAPGGSLQDSPQQQQQLSRREQVAQQFHRLYRLHGCLQQWRCSSAEAVLARCKQETDKIMAQQQAEVGWVLR